MCNSYLFALCIAWKAHNVWIHVPRERKKRVNKFKVIATYEIRNITKNNEYCWKRRRIKWMNWRNAIWWCKCGVDERLQPTYPVPFVQEHETKLNIMYSCWCLIPIWLFRVYARVVVHLLRVASERTFAFKETKCKKSIATNSRPEKLFCSERHEIEIKISQKSTENSKLC